MGKLKQLLIDTDLEDITDPNEPACEPFNNEGDTPNVTNEVPF